MVMRAVRRSATCCVCAVRASNKVVSALDVSMFSMGFGRSVLLAGRVGASALAGRRAPVNALGSSLE